MDRPPEFELAMDLIPDDLVVKIVRDYVMALESWLDKKKDSVLKELAPSAILRLDELEATNAWQSDRIDELEGELADAMDKAKGAAWALHEMKCMRESEGGCG